MRHTPHGSDVDDFVDTPPWPPDSFPDLTATLWNYCLHLLADARDGQLDLSVVESVHRITGVMLQAGSGALPDEEDDDQ